MPADQRSLIFQYDINKLLVSFKGSEQSMPDILRALNSLIPLRSVVLIEGHQEQLTTSLWHIQGISTVQDVFALSRAKAAHERFGGLKPRVPGGGPARPAQTYLLELPLNAPACRSACQGDFAVLPLVVAGGLIFATLQIEAARAFGETELALVTTFSNQLAVSLDHHQRMLAYRDLLVQEQDGRAEVEASNQRLQDLVDSVNVTVWEAVACSNQVTFVSQRSEGMFGYPTSSWLSDPNFRVSIVHPDDRGAMLRHSQEAVAAGQDYQLEYRVIAASGQIVWVKDIVQVTTDATGHGMSLRGVMVDTSERHGAEQDLRVSEELNRQIVEGISDAVAVLDLSGRLIKLNSPGQTLFDLHDLSAVILSQWSALWPSGPGRERMTLAIEEAAQGRASSFQGFCPTAYGQPKWWDVKVVPTLSSEGVADKLLVISRDISQDTIARELLHEAKEAAEVANQSKTAFLANMSHEIRTPLAAIVGFGELLKDPELTPIKSAHFIETITRNGHELTHLINDILDMSKVEAGHLDVTKQAFSLHALLDDIEQLLSNQAMEKGVLLSFSVADNVPEQIVTDASRLRQILINVIANAIKFTDVGSVRIGVSMVEHLADGRSLVALSVKDSGPGMSATEQGKIFQPFMQGKTSIARKFGGTGLGLVLSRMLAQKLGGDLVLATSAPGRGSDFVTTIDIGLHTDKPAHGAAKAQKKGDIAAADTLYRTRDLTGTNILVAEDVLDNQILIGHLLKKHGAHVDFVGDGAQAVERAQSGDYDLILMDMQMPVCDGYEATRELRRLQYHRPIVALTAFAMKEDRDECLKAGCDDHLAKPLNHSALLLTVEHYAVGLQHYFKNKDHGQYPGERDGHH